MGHLAMGLLASSVAWFVWDGRTSLAFVGFTASTTMLPDVDLLLSRYLQTVHHHGVTHTLLFVTVVALLAGQVVTAVADPLFRRWYAETEDVRLTEREVTLFVTGGLLVGGVSHILADMLSAPDIAQPIEPLWPFFDKPISVDVIYYSSIWWNLGLLLVALALHLALFASDSLPLESRHLRGREVRHRNRPE